MKLLFIHLGFQKTGSTFLQQEFFPYLKKINYMNKKYLNGKRSFVGDLLSLLELDLNTSQINSFRKKYNLVNLSSKNLLSNESLLGNPWNENSFLSREKRIIRLKKIFSGFNLKIILCVRDKKTLYKSLYSQYVHEGGTKKEIDFIKPQKLFFNKFFDKDKAFALLKKHFSKKDIFIVSYEDFRQDKNCFLESLVGFLDVAMPYYKDVKTNVGVKGWKLKVLRFLNKFFKSVHNPNGFIPMINSPLGKLGPRILFQRVKLRTVFRKIRTVFRSEAGKNPCVIERSEIRR